MAACEIRDGLTASVLPPREGFSPEAVGAVGLMVHALGGPGDLVIGKRLDHEPFAGHRYLAMSLGLWPPAGGVARYYAVVLKTLGRLRPARIEIHNRADLARRAASAHPRSSVALFLHNDPQAMRGARRAEERAFLLRRVQVICVSAFLKDRFMHGLDPDAGEACLLPNAIDLAALPPPQPQAAREPLILFAGRIVADKGADAFVRAVHAVRARLPEWRAVMIGADRFRPGAPETPFLRRLRPLAAAAGIEMQGYRRRTAVLDAMARAAIVVVPSRWAEPFGLVALEALASGAALICSRQGGLPEVAGEAAIYADPDEPEALERAILRLAADPELRRRLSEAGLARAARFDVRDARAALASLRASGGPGSARDPLGP